MKYLTRHDIQTIITWLSPDFLTALAKEYGIGVALELWEAEETVRKVLETPGILAVLGSLQAYTDVRRMIRGYIRFIRHREKVSARDLGLAQALRAAGYVGNYQKVYPLSSATAWRSQVSFALWPDGEGQIPGSTLVCVGNASQRAADLAVIKAVSEAMISLPELNRAILQGAVWSRTSGHVMVHFEPKREQVRSVVVDASKFDTISKLGNELSRKLKSLIKAEKHELRYLADELIVDWAKTGFIASPAAVMISPVGSKGELRNGWAALAVRTNGIPVALTICKKERGNVLLGLTIDHRAWDAEQSGKFMAFLRSRVPEILKLEGEFDADSTDRREQGIRRELAVAAGEPSTMEGGSESQGA